MYSSSNYTIFERVLWQLYIVDVGKVNNHDETNVPDFISEMVPIFIAMLLIENVILYLKGKPLVRLNDGFTSIATGMMMTLFKVLPFGIEFYGYNFLYGHRVFNPDWRSPWTWWYGALGVDFCYYWVHRVSHEVNIFWGIGHNVHHSSEEYNFTTSLRQPALYKFLTFGLYHPLALIGVPLHVVLAHVQFTMIYQFWIHTEAIDHVGPFEWIFNTASHHRVHHGMNNWCLDKNYGSILIIWDRIFGTFQAERKDEKIIYGLVDQPQTFEPHYLQTFYGKDVVQRAVEKGYVVNFLKGLFYGPAWYPGGPRLGDEPDMTAKAVPRNKYDPILPWHIRIYVYIHFVITIIIHQKYIDNFTEYHWMSVVIFSAFIFWTLFIMGSLLDAHFWVGKMEIGRCILAVAFIDKYILFGNVYIDIGLTGFMGLSSIFWLYNYENKNKQIKNR